MADDQKTPGLVPYKLFKQRNPEYCEDYWARCRVFYKGGKELLENDALMRRVFPQHRNEDPAVYDMRKGIAHYTNYSGEIIDELLAKLGSDPIRLETETDNDFFPGFLENCAPPGSRPVKFSELLNNILLTAMQCKRSWVLIDMPPADPMNQADSLAEQERSGALNAWCVQVQPESVIDWEVDANGVLQWALLCYKSKKRDGLMGSRGSLKETFVYYTKDAWAKWEVEYEEGKPPGDEKEIPVADMGVHNFGRVPLEMFELPDGLWAMGKLESLAREHFNKRNALSWAEFKALLPMLYEFHDNSPEYQAFGGEGGDIDRGFNQPRSSAHVQVRNSGDRVEWAAPPTGSFTHSLASCNSVRDEMHRVVHQMARAADVNKNNTNRSGESKMADENAANIVLEALGTLMRAFSVRLLTVVAVGRGDGDLEWVATGMSDFQAKNLGAFLETESLLDTAVEIPSPTFKRLRKFQLAKKVLGDAVREVDLEIIQTEIETYYSLEQEQDAEDLRDLDAGTEGDDDEGEAAPVVGRKVGR